MIYNIYDCKSESVIRKGLYSLKYAQRVKSFLDRVYGEYFLIRRRPHVHFIIKSAYGLFKRCKS
jgi:hypothetical protein